MNLTKISSTISSTISKWKNGDYLYQAVLSDVHLNHRRTPTEHIISNLMRDFQQTPDTAKLDIIWVSGDLLDSLAAAGSDDNFLIVHWVSSLLRYAKKHNIVIRVLEGTGSHDYTQSRYFSVINEGVELGVDVKYVDRVSVEFIEALGISVLYVPDNVHSDADVVWKMVQEALHEAGVEKVDYAIMHGLFEFQLPAHVHDPATHLSSRYQSIVRRLVYIGHHHTHRIEDRVVVPGSYDRLKQNEEEPKGHIRVKDWIALDRKEISFIENKGAKIYKRINLSGLEVEDALKRLSMVETYPARSAFEVIAKSTDPISKSLETIRSRYPEYIWSMDIEKTEKLEKKIEEMAFNFQPIDITKENLVSLTRPRLDGDDAIVELAIQLLEAEL